MMGRRWRRARNVTGGCQHVGVRPALKAGLLPLWGDRGSLLDGSRDRSALVAAAQAYGVAPEATGQLLATLAAAGVLDDFPSRLHASMPDELRARLAPELAAASLAYGDADGGARTMARRRAAFVRVHGAGRTGACVASFLAASGVGRVACTDPELAEPADLAPAGLIRDDLGEPRQAGA